MSGGFFEKDQIRRLSALLAETGYDRFERGTVSDAG